MPGRTPSVTGRDIEGRREIWQQTPPSRTCAPLPPLASASADPIAAGERLSRCCGEGSEACNEGEDLPRVSPAPGHYTPPREGAAQARVTVTRDDTVGEIVWRSTRAGVRVYCAVPPPAFPAPINKDGSRSPISLKPQGRRNWVTIPKRRASGRQASHVACLPLHESFTRAAVPSRPWAALELPRSLALPRRPAEVCQRVGGEKWVTDRLGPAVQGRGATRPIDPRPPIDRTFPRLLGRAGVALRAAPSAAVCHSHLSLLGITILRHSLSPIQVSLAPHHILPLPPLPQTNLTPTFLIVLSHNSFLAS
ncbi:hypothetical protein E2C01_049174 [Portunus trituberculatus]|uniref:Uncharacterized protein n=1 Tax=Portunus trituberculatus TaxID=210409 RepID=A0A5B7GD80_PORTR|nr:hypothetical protein [Portunus trituberculatus]